MGAGLLINKALANVGLKLVRSSTIGAMEEELTALRADKPVLAESEHLLNGVYGHRMFVDARDQGFRLNSLVGTEPQGDDAFFGRTIKKGQTVLDLGANIGLYTLLFAKYVGPAGKVIAFEPGPLSSSLLRANIWMNGYQNVKIEQAVVADKSGTMDLHVCPTGESDNRADGSIDPSNNWPRITLPCFRVDDYLGDTPVDFVKMDIQGSEFAALRGMPRTLERNKAIQIVMEFTPELIDDKDAFFRLLSSAGFSMLDLDNEKPVTREFLLSNYGGPGQPGHMNILLRRV